MTDTVAADLGQRFRQGEESAIREIHARYGGAVATVARSIVGDPDLVSEIVQQTFVKAWKAAASFESDRELAPWLYSIARRTAIDILRREHRGGIVLTEVGDDEPARNVVSFERTWELWEIRRAIDDLPASEREVVRMQRMVGLTHNEIAERLGVPVGTVKSRSAKAHKRLAAALRHLQTEGATVEHPESNRPPSTSQPTVNPSVPALVEDGESR